MGLERESDDEDELAKGSAVERVELGRRWVDMLRVHISGKIDPEGVRGRLRTRETPERRSIVVFCALGWSGDSGCYRMGQIFKFQIQK